MRTHTSWGLLFGGVVAFAMSMGASAGGLGGLGDLAGGADLSKLGSGSAGNAAGVVSYCVQNNYLGGDAASSMKDKLLGKVGGSDKAVSDTDYQDGAKGIVKTGDGKSVDLSSLGGGAGDVKSKLSKKACGAVLDHAQSLL